MCQGGSRDMTQHCLVQARLKSPQGFLLLNEHGIERSLVCDQTLRPTLLLCKWHVTISYNLTFVVLRTAN